MSWLLPLGFLGLIGLAVLLLIYIIRPNYQQKQISSTFVWRLSLKYQKKRMPISKLKNLLLLLLQILILTLCAFLLAGPVIMEDVVEHDEVVIVLDASASMRAQGDNDTDTRFVRAVTDAQTLVDETLKNNGRVTVIFADKTADYIAHRATKDSGEQVIAELQSLIDDDACTYGSADIDGALKLADSVYRTAPRTRVVLYTATEYANHTGVEVRNMAKSDGSDWNVAVLDLRAEKSVENIYTFLVDLACYGRDIDVTLGLEVNMVNSSGEQLKYTLSNDPKNPSERIRLMGNRVTTVAIDTASVKPDESPDKLPIFEFSDVTAFVRVADSLGEDNSFSLYGNKKQDINIQYASSRPNSFFAAAFLSMQNALQQRWNVNFREVRTGDEMATSGYDLYVFEDSAIPRVMPTDGVVFFVNPQSIPSGAGFGLDSYLNTKQTALADGEKHPITNNIFAGNIEVTRYAPIRFSGSAADSFFAPLLYCNGNPVLAAKNLVSSKVIVMSFSVNYSTAAMSPDFPRLILNIVNYYMPSTFDKTVYDVNEVATVNARGEKLKLNGNGIENEYDTFPLSLELSRIGTYTATQTIISGKVVTEKFFVKIPKYESNIVRKEAVLSIQFDPIKRSRRIDDLCVYFAAVLVVLLVVERLLQYRISS